jgi:hypothetical protein
MPKRKAAKRRAVKPAKKRLFFPFPLILFLLLCAGVALAYMTLNVKAQDIKITAQIQGPPVTTPAVITSPADGTHFTAVPIEVKGDCTANAAYVEIFRNNVMSGSAICDVNSKFSLNIDLFAGRNDLTAHSFNINDNEGPVSAVVTVYYDVAEPTGPASVEKPPVTSSPSTPSSSIPSTSTPDIAPFFLKTVFVYKGYYIDQQVEWPIEVSGGNKPYAFNIDWGDGKNSVISRKGEGPFNIKHKYEKPGPNKNSYTIKVQASDSDGRYAYLEFFVIVTERDTSGLGNTIYSKPPPALGNLRTWLWWAWPVYTSIFLMAISYKLGEREEFKILRRRGLLRR